MLAKDIINKCSRDQLSVVDDFFFFTIDVF